MPTDSDGRVKPSEFLRDALLEVTTDAGVVREVARAGRCGGEADCELSAEAG